MDITLSERLVAQIAGRSERFLGLVESLKRDDFGATTSAGWTVQELLAHVAFWDEAVYGFMTTVLRAQPLPDGWTFGSGYVPDLGAAWPHFDIHNAREAEWGRQQSPETVRERLDSAHQLMLESVGTVTDQEFQAQSQYYEDLGSHYLDHLDELEGIANK